MSGGGALSALRVPLNGDRPDGATVPRAGRLHYIDWLRVAAIAGVFVYHSLRPFDPDGWHVKNAETSDVIGVFMSFFESFGLAVLFLLAGAGTRFALRKRSWPTFLRERTARLLVPFVAGTLLLSPVQGFIEATHEGTYSGSFLDYLGPWAQGVGDALGKGLSPTVFGIGYHLWFLGFLFAISVISLPLCEWLMGGRGRASVDALAGAVARPGASLLFAIPILLLLTVGVQLGTAEHDWLEFGWYSAYFMTGFLLFSDDRFMAAVRRDLWPALGAAAVSTVLLVATPAGGLLATMADGLDGPHLLAGGLFVVEGWAWTIVILNIGLRAARLQRPVSVRVGDAVLPVYVIHQPVILAVAFFVVQWPFGILPKWVAVFGASLAITLALVELGLHTPVTRVLLGARVRGPTPASVAEPPAMAGTPTVKPFSGAHDLGPR